MNARVATSAPTEASLREDIMLGWLLVWLVGWLAVSVVSVVTMVLDELIRLMITN